MIHKSEKFNANAIDYAEAKFIEHIKRHVSLHALSVYTSCPHQIHIVIVCKIYVWYNVNNPVIKTIIPLT